MVLSLVHFKFHHPILLWFIFSSSLVLRRGVCKVYFSHSNRTVHAYASTAGLNALCRVVSCVSCFAIFSASSNLKGFLLMFLCCTRVCNPSLPTGPLPFELPPYPCLFPYVSFSCQSFLFLLVCKVLLPRQFLNLT